MNGKWIRGATAFPFLSRQNSLGYKDSLFFPFLFPPRIITLLLLLFTRLLYSRALSSSFPSIPSLPSGCLERQRNEDVIRQLKILCFRKKTYCKENSCFGGFIQYFFIFCLMKPHRSESLTLSRYRTYIRPPDPALRRESPSVRPTTAYNDFFFPL